MSKAPQDIRRWTNQLARIRPGHRSIVPGIESLRWYQIADPDDQGFFIELDGSLCFVSWEHFDIRSDSRRRYRRPAPGHSNLR